MPDALSSQADAIVERRAKFRDFLAAFNPSALPQRAIDSGYVVSDLRGGISETIANRVEIDPNCQQVVIGGIGSGKTTEMLLAGERLRQAGWTPWWFDLSAKFDVATAGSNSLLYSYGTELAGHFSNEDEEVQAVRLALRQFRFSDEVRPAFKILTQRLQERLRIVCIFDGLDRIRNKEKYRRIAWADLQEFRRIGIPTISSGPIWLQIDSETNLRDHFDRIHTLHSIKFDSSLLDRVFEARDKDGLLTAESRERIKQGAGGILRDLITICRDAAEAAYGAGGDRIEEEDVRSAVKTLGSDYLRGLSSADIEIVRVLNRIHRLAIDASEVQNLLATRRIIEYSPTDFEVHPALVAALGYRS